MSRTSFSPVSLKEAERVGAMETPVTVMDSKKWSFMVIMAVMPMKLPLADVATQNGSLFMIGRVLEEFVGDCVAGLRVRYLRSCW